MVFQYSLDGALFLFLFTGMYPYTLEQHLYYFELVMSHFASNVKSRSFIFKTLVRFMMPLHKKIKVSKYSFLHEWAI